MEIAIPSIFLLVGLIAGLILGKKIASSSSKISPEDLRKLELDRDKATKDAISSKSDLKNHQLRIEELKDKLQELEQENRQLHKGESAQNEKIAAFEKRVKEQKEEIHNIQESFKKQSESTFKDIQEKFQALANDVLKEKNKEAKLSIGEILNPLKKEIDDFKKDIADKYTKEATDKASLKTEIKQLLELNNTLSAQAHNLTSALSGSVKAQGNWGEIVLERVLSYSGLKDGEDFIREGKGLKLVNAEGDLQKPDVIVMLPDEKHLIIDSKVTLNSYQNIIESSNEDEQRNHVNIFIKSVENHIDGLSKKGYELLDKLVTPEYVMMFMPIEGALSLALEVKPELFEYGWSKKVILVGPTNLLATLKAVNSVWRHEKQEKNAMKIAEQGGKLYDKFVGFLDDMEDIKKHIKNTENSYDEAFKKLATGRGNLIKQVEDMKELGAKAKKAIDKKHLEDSIE